MKTAYSALENTVDKYMKEVLENSVWKQLESKCFDKEVKNEEK